MELREHPLQIAVGRAANTQYLLIGFFFAAHLAPTRRKTGNAEKVPPPDSTTRRATLPHPNEKGGMPKVGAIIADIDCHLQGQGKAALGPGGPRAWRGSDKGVTPGTLGRCARLGEQHQDLLQAPGSEYG